MSQAAAQVVPRAQESSSLLAVNPAEYVGDVSESYRRSANVSRKILLEKRLTAGAERGRESAKFINKLINQCFFWASSSQ